MKKNIPILEPSKPEDIIYNPIGQGDVFEMQEFPVQDSMTGWAEINQLKTESGKPMQSFPMQFAIPKQTPHSGNQQKTLLDY